MKKYTERIVNIAFCLLLVAILTGPISRYLARAQLVEENAQMDRERKLETALESALCTVDDAETGQRGFLLTHDPAYLAPFADAAARVQEEMQQLSQLTSHEADDHARVDLLGSLVHKEFEELNQAIEAARSPADAPLNLARSREGNATMDRIRQVVGELRTRTKNDLDRRERVLAVDLARTARMFLLVTVLSFFILIVSFVLVRRFMTEKQRAEAQLLAAMAKAESSSNAKTAFLTNMSHEIRTPMTAIVGFSELLLQPVQSLTDRQEALQVIRRNARHLLDLINDVLDLSRIEAGKMVTCPTTVDLIRTLGEIASMMRSRAVEKGLVFRVQFQGPIPRKIQTDPLRLRQVLVNLLGNAIKFTANGEVRLVVSCPTIGTGSDTLGKDVRFDITDTGIGMTPEQMARLFQPFTQADESTTRKFGGSGLGLDISKRLAKMLGGDITVQSIPGVGSTFTLSIDGSPLEDVQTVTDATALLIGTSVETEGVEENKINGHVLLVEDGPDNQQLIRYLLERAGAKVTLVENGRLAVDKATSEPFDLILMDMQMPELDGYGATSELRRRGIQVPIIALTAHAMSDDRDKCIGAGCTDYLTKPLDSGLLIKTVGRHLSSAKDANVPVALPLVGASIKSRFAGDPRMIGIMNQFVAALPVRVGELLRSLEANDKYKLSMAAHRIKGSAGGYGFTPISELAAEVEKQLKADITAHGIREIVQQLVELIRRVEGYDRALETAEVNTPAAA